MQSFGGMKVILSYLSVPEALYMQLGSRWMYETAISRVQTSLTVITDPLHLTICYRGQARILAVNLASRQATWLNMQEQDFRSDMPCYTVDVRYKNEVGLLAIYFNHGCYNMLRQFEEGKKFVGNQL